MQKSGAISKDIQFYIQKFGMLGGGNFSSVAKNAPHPAALLVFLEWLTSPEIQTRASKELGTGAENKKADKSTALVPLAEKEKYRTPAAPNGYFTKLTELLSEKL